jgi:HK97 family phage prohead protease
VPEKKQLAAFAIKSRDGKKYTITASTPDVDRDGEVIVPAAFKNLDAYLGSNPVILWAHNYAHPPIGRATDGRITDEALELDIEFATTPFAREVKGLYDTGFMNAFSVGFIPKNYTHDSDGNLVFTEADLLEVSAVPVPANAFATMRRQAKGKGLELGHLTKTYVEDGNLIYELSADGIADYITDVSTLGGLAPEDIKGLIEHLTSLLPGSTPKPEGESVETPVKRELRALLAHYKTTRG